MQAGSRGSFRKVHPALQTCMTSFREICQTLQQAEPDWWKDCSSSPAGEEEHFSNALQTEEPENADDDAEIFASAQQEELSL